jgi:hypothetical protein
MFPSLPSNFRGTVLIGPAAPNIVNANCVAWTLSADLGVLASYPPSGLFWPVSQTERIWRVWNKVLAAGTASFALKLPPSLMIDQTVGRLNIIANPTLNQVYILMNLAELIGDSDSELSFALGHALGHIIQFRVGALNFFPDDRERDADVYGMVVSWEAGYDPYGAAGVLGKLFMVSGGENMLAQDFDFLQSAGLDLRTSFGNRLANIYDTLKAGCAIAENQSACAAYKSVVHPHFPLYAPL